MTISRIFLLSAVFLIFQPGSLHGQSRDLFAAFENLEDDLEKFKIDSCAWTSTDSLLSELSSKLNEVIKHNSSVKKRKSRYLAMASVNNQLKSFDLFIRTLKFNECESESDLIIGLRDSLTSIDKNYSKTFQSFKLSEYEYPELYDSLELATINMKSHYQEGIRDYYYETEKLKFLKSLAYIDTLRFDTQNKKLLSVLNAIVGYKSTQSCGCCCFQKAQAFEMHREGTLMAIQSFRKTVWRKYKKTLE